MTSAFLAEFTQQPQHGKARFGYRSHAPNYRVVVKLRLLPATSESDLIRFRLNQITKAEGQPTKKAEGRPTKDKGIQSRGSKPRIAWAFQTAGLPAMAPTVGRTQVRGDRRKLKKYSPPRESSRWIRRNRLSKLPSDEQHDFSALIALKF